METKIPIGISSCLIGEKVRWNGDHKQDRYVTDVLGKFFEWVPVCPEVEVGMGVPRETVALYGDLESPRMLGKQSRRDWSVEMARYSKDRIRQIGREGLSGFIFKSKSPSCGLARVPVHSEEEVGKARHGAGLFARQFTREFPRVPVEDEGRLHDPKIRENFIVRVFSFNRLQNLISERFSVGSWVAFHTQHKFLLLAHSRKHYDALGQLIAKVKTFQPQDFKNRYGAVFMDALSCKTTPKKNADVLLHMMGFFKKLIPGEDKKDILEAIDDYRLQRVPLIVPVTLIRHYVKKYDVVYLQEQIYLNPHPKELMLRNHV